ncbi:MAG: hypothetical protein JSV92_03985 [archaeon]|nr:MAG: hypothetical protein JSV92_03985 [archaeon]
MDSLTKEKDEINFLLSGLDHNLCGAAKEVRGLGLPCSNGYADAILCKNHFNDGNAVEISFEKYTGGYDSWKEGTEKVQEILEKYFGDDAIIKAGNQPLEKYFNFVEHSRQPQDKVIVEISVPGQDKLLEIRKLIA